MPKKKVGKQKIRDIKHVFLDIVGFTQEGRIPEDQEELIGVFNRIVMSALKALLVQEDQRILLPTGDGVCICLYGDVDYDLHVKLGLEILKRIAKHNDTETRPQIQFAVRIALNAHPDIMVQDINGQNNIAGKGINDAQRILTGSGRGNLVLSEGVFRNLSGFSVYRTSSIEFKPFKIIDKHNVEHSVYLYSQKDAVGLNNELPEFVDEEGYVRSDRFDKTKSDTQTVAIFWLGHDLRWTGDRIIEGSSREKTLHGFSQILKNYAHSGIQSQELAAELKRLNEDATQTRDEEWSLAFRKQLDERIGNVLARIKTLLNPSQEEPSDTNQSITRIGNESMEAQSWSIHRGKIFPADMLHANKGTVAVWARVSDFHNRIGPKRYRYIVSTAGNGGKSFGNPALARYPNAWAICRVLPTVKFPTGQWSFFCNGTKPPQVKLRSADILAPGWHLFTIEWSRTDGYVRFYIDDQVVNQARFGPWPEGSLSEIILGTWPNDSPTHRFGSEVGPLYSIDRVLRPDELLAVLADRPV